MNTYYSCAQLPLPHLNVFQHNTGLSSAILMEYLPNPLIMNCITYSKEQMTKTVKDIQQIHSALVEHIYFNEASSPPSTHNTPYKRSNPSKSTKMDCNGAVIQKELALIELPW
ncbi:uncharacterized protein BDCG_16768 [Blastomyces dermatitidis ER-3]|uniref:Uncharacterized protein n=1 Tax=Ajellomyces dermatitidis (strain ER-3 / ATCC MYA-2586) TaxID=559297 RepID=A0ABX2VUG4_AJEDR|nr:uncharacterized protein BDCG_16768 [Blastomyces dermatitidis ER-3]OAT00819.1 hypothetical protein BDCG_16768 [Blastomyces dermatitidis ER-3]